MTDKQRWALAKILSKALRHNKHLRKLERTVPGLKLEPLCFHVFDEILNVMGLPSNEDRLREWVFAKFSRDKPNPSRIQTMEKFLREVEHEINKSKISFN